MLKKKLWISYLPGQEKEDKLKALGGQLDKYGFSVSAGFWEDDLKKLAWINHREVLEDPSEADIWLIAGEKEQFERESIRYGLTVLKLSIEPKRKGSIPVFILAQGFSLASEDLPLAFRDVPIFSDSDPGWVAKLVAKAHKKFEVPQYPYRCLVHAHEYFGQWFEVGPSSGTWNGAMFGISEGEITHHAVGPKGFPPEKSIVEYSLRGLKAELGGTEYTAWAVQNKIGDDESYYVKVVGAPSRVIFGEHPGEEDAEVYVFDMV